MLWFDVGIKRYTTNQSISKERRKLWFDVGIKRYTTCLMFTLVRLSCGLM